MKVTKAEHDLIIKELNAILALIDTKKISSKVIKDTRPQQISKDDLDTWYGWNSNKVFHVACHRRLFRNIIMVHSTEFGTSFYTQSGAYATWLADLEIIR